jgi:HAD superfamily hydrolase (TIGR01509 family)
MAQPAPPTILFDIDGTLVDSVYLHALAWRRAMVEHDHDVGTWRIHRMIGAASEVLMGELLGAPSDEVKATWKDRFDELVPEVRAFPRAGELLQVLHDRGAQVVLASSSPGELVDGHLAAIGADGAIDHVLSAADVDEAKPSPEVFQAAMDAAGAPVERCLAVGDATWDVEAAARCGLETIGVTCGGFSRAELLDAGAVAVYDDVADLLEHLDDSPIGRLLG